MEKQVTHPYYEHRRANRVAWERPMRITQPLQLQGKVLDASAVGLLVRVERCPELRTGDWIDVEIPRAEDGAVLSRRVRIVRLDIVDSEMLLGLELV